MDGFIKVTLGELIRVDSTQIRLLREPTIISNFFAIVEQPDTVTDKYKSKNQLQNKNMNMNNDLIQWTDYFSREDYPTGILSYSCPRRSDISKSERQQSQLVGVSPTVYSPCSYIQAYNQSHQKLQLGRQIKFITQSEGSSQQVFLESDAQLRQMFEDQKVKFVVSVDSSSSEQPSGVSVFEKPLCYDERQSNYYLLKCTIRPNSYSHNKRLLSVMYVLAEGLCLQASNPSLVRIFLATLACIQPSWNKINYLLLQTTEDDLTYADSTTNYETRDQRSLDWSSKKHQRARPRTKTLNQSEPYNTYAKYFSKVIRVIQPFGGALKIASHCKDYLVRGATYSWKSVESIVAAVNSYERVNVPLIESELMQRNMQECVEFCKESYSELVRSLFLEGRPQNLYRLTSILNEVYQQIVGCFDQEFQGLQHLQQFQIFRGMLKRHIEQSQHQILNLNSTMRRTECLNSLKSNMEMFKTQLLFSEEMEGQFKSSGFSLSAMKQFITGVFMPRLHREIGALHEKNEKLVMHNLNYSRNPVELLRNLQARVEYCRQKKKRLEDCLLISQREYDTLDNLNHGLQLELIEQRRALKQLQDATIAHSVSP